VWDRELREVACLRGHTGSVGWVWIAPDGGRLVSGSSDRTVRVWDLRAGEIACLPSPGGGITCASLSPDGGSVVAGTEKGLVQVWELATRRELFRHPGHEKAVQAAFFTTDGLRVVSAGYDDAVRIWDARSGDCLQTLRGETDAFHRALGVPLKPFWARIGRWELDIHSSRTGEVVAWFPTAPKRLRSPFSERTWAGASGNHLYLFTLHGQE
jgi:WD40 repeat protein